MLQRSTEVIHMVVEHMPKEFEGAHQLMQQKFQADSDVITFEVLKSAMQTCVSRAQKLKRQQDKRQAIEEVQEKSASVVPDKVDSLQQALISTMQQLPSKMQALVTSNNAFNERQSKGGGSDWQGTSNGGNHGGGRAAPGAAAANAGSATSLGILPGSASTRNRTMSIWRSSGQVLRNRGFGSGGGIKVFLNRCHINCNRRLLPQNSWTGKREMCRA